MGLRIMIYNRVCPVCGTAFTSHHKRAVYDRDVCRVAASRGRSRLKLLSKTQKKLLKTIRENSPKTATHIEKAVSEHGVECFDAVAAACLVAFSDGRIFEKVAS